MWPWSKLRKAQRAVDDDEPLETWHSPREWFVAARDRDDVWTHSVFFDDWIAHEQDDVVRAYVDFVAGRRGVRRAAREDRELVIIQANRRLSAAVIGAEAEQWLAARLPHDA